MRTGNIRLRFITICVIALIGISGVFAFRSFERSRRLVLGPLPAASAASCTGAGYRLQHNFTLNIDYYCKDLRSTKNAPGECSRSGNPSILLGFPQNGPYPVNSDVPLNASVQSLGSGDLIVKEQNGNWAEGGRIDWGDGNGWQTVDLTLTSPLHATHKYPNAIGTTAIHVMSWAQFKYQAGPESGSYESCVDATATLKIIP